MRVLWFGIYSRGEVYPRNRNLIKGLRLHGVEVLEAHYPVLSSPEARWEAVRNPLAAGVSGLSVLASLPVLSMKFMRAPSFGAVVVGHPGSFHVHLAKTLCRITRRRVPVLLDVFFPLFDTLVEDRALFREGGPAARALWKWERASCRIADCCLMDTQVHARHLARRYGLAPGRVRAVPVGPTVEPVPYPPELPRSGETFTVLYVGTYIPLHGVETILRAARRLKEEKGIRFHLVGRGQEKAKALGLAQSWGLQNVTFTPWIPTRDLPWLIRSADLALGVFGTTAKAQRVIPSKVFDICAAGAPLVTAETPAVREVFRHGENAYLVPPGDPEALARAVLHLRGLPEARRLLARGAHRLGMTRFSLDSIGGELTGIIRELTAFFPGNDTTMWYFKKKEVNLDGAGENR